MYVNEYLNIINILKIYSRMFNWRKVPLKVVNNLFNLNCFVQLRSTRELQQTSKLQNLLFRSCCLDSEFALCCLDLATENVGLATENIQWR